MEEYDLVVIGSGAGLNLVDAAVNTGMKVALAENGPMGGTCLNRGCIPSKMWIYPADIIRQIEDGVHVGVNASLESADFETVRRRTWGAVLRERDHIFEAIKQDPRATLLQDTVRFIGDKTLQASDRTLRAPKIVIAGGARSAIPNIPGLDDVNYHTSETIFDITRLPQSMMIIGGGYKACEFGHFFSAFGTKVTILQRNVRLLPREELEMGDVVMRRLGKHVTIRTAYDVQEVRKSDGNVQVIGRDRQTMAPMRDEAELLLIGAGMKSNADWLDPTVTGVQLDERGYVVVNEHLETTAPGIWALGDITGRHMFRHTANYESRIVWYNLSAQNKAIIDEHAIPHAVYTYPTIGSVGMSENEVKKSGRKYLVGLSSYANVAKGEAMANNDGLVKVLVEAGTKRILGAHIVGPEADLLVQQLVYLMNAGDESYLPLARSQIIHPSLNEAVAGAFARLTSPEEHHTH
ncbi:MAG: dihydrolipoyl dehydrogenase [Euryarchaeota archaeon]|nr:dihydrolipoyl dehydrogenase [Euryarchaeota archaeon]